MLKTIILFILLFQNEYSVVDLENANCRFIVNSDKIRSFELGVEYEEIKNDKSLSIVDTIKISKNKIRMITIDSDKKNKYIFNFDNDKLVRYTFSFSIKNTTEFEEMIIKIRKKKDLSTKFIWENEKLLFSYKENNNHCKKFLRIKYSGFNAFVFGGIGYVD